MPELKEGEKNMEAEPKFTAKLRLMDFRVGHWKETKTPPWWLSLEVLGEDQPEFVALLEQKAKGVEWKDGQSEALVGSAVVEWQENDVDTVDIYASKTNDPDCFLFCAYPKGKSLDDFWGDEDK